jgi:transposase-like protein
MRFVPPRCPNPECSQHDKPTGRFFERRGSYRARCRLAPVPRFRCRACHRTFSQQTFRHDRGDRRPDCNEPLFLLLVSGVGLRQCGRLLRLDPHSVADKMRKLALTCELLHQSLARKLPAARTFLLDEEETYEGTSIRPLTMPVLIERDTWFVVATAVGPIRRLAPPGSARRRRQDADELRNGRRPDHSRRCVRAVLDQLAARIGAGSITLQTDQKGSYGPIARRVFGSRLVHEVTPSTLIRSTCNPLFPINTTLAMTRDNCGRLRRRSWLVSKRAARLQQHFAIFTAYRNYVRRRFNRDAETESPAKLLGLVPRALTGAEVLRWRQDWGVRSIHPMSRLASATIR